MCDLVLYGFAFINAFTLLKKRKKFQEFITIPERWEFNSQVYGLCFCHYFTLSFQHFNSFNFFRALNTLHAQVALNALKTPIPVVMLLNTRGCMAKTFKWELWACMKHIGSFWIHPEHYEIYIMSGSGNL